MSKKLWSRSCHVGILKAVGTSCERELNWMDWSLADSRLRTWQKKMCNFFSIFLYLKECLLHHCKPENKQKYWLHILQKPLKGWRLTQWKEIHKHWTHCEAHKWLSAALTTWPWLYCLPHQSIPPLLHSMASVEQSSVSIQQWSHRVAISTGLLQVLPCRWPRLTTVHIHPFSAVAPTL